jgi:hypothetical protein
MAGGTTSGFEQLQVKLVPQQTIQLLRSKVFDFRRFPELFSRGLWAVEASCGALMPRRMGASESGCR